MATKRAAIYARISQDRAGAGLGVARQEQDCRDLADRLGWEVREVLADNDTSAYSGKPRPGYQALLTGLRDGTFTAVIAWHGDRLHRSPIELEEFIAVVEAAKAQVQTVQSGEIDLSTPTGRLVARQVGSVARYESEHKSARTRRALLQRAEAGRAAKGGTRGFGYDKDMNVIEAEAAVVRHMADLVLSEGFTAGAVARWANREGHTTAGGKPWGPRRVNEVLCSARIAGWRSHAPGLRSSSAERIFGLPFTHAGTWPAIIERETVERLREALTRNTSIRAKANTRYLLSGFLRHHGCEGDGKFVGVEKNGARYRCSPKAPVGHGCGGPQIVAAETERVVLAALVHHLGTRVGREQDQRAEPDFAETLTAIKRTEQAIERLGDQVDDDEITRAEYVRRAARLHDRLEALRGKLASSEMQTRAHLPDWAVDALRRGTFLRWWNGASIDAKRALLARSVEAVIAAPGKRGSRIFDPSRLRVIFTDGTAWTYAQRDAVGTVGPVELTIFA